MNNNLFRLLAPAMMLLTAACGGQQLSQNVAQSTLDSINIYEKQVEAKIAAEKKYYQDTLNTLQIHQVGKNALEIEASDDEAKTDTDVQQSLIWLQISNNAYRDAQILAEQLMMARSPAIRAEIIKFLEKGVQDDIQAQQVIRSKNAELRLQIAANLASIDYQKKQLAEVKKGLEKLTKPTGTKDTLKILKEHAELIKDAISADD